MGTDDKPTREQIRKAAERTVGRFKDIQDKTKKPKNVSLTVANVKELLRLLPREISLSECVDTLIEELIKELKGHKPPKE